MITLPLLAAALAAAAPASAQIVPAERIGAMIEAVPSLDGAAIPSLNSIPAPAGAPGAAAAAAAAPDGSVVPPGLWATLAAPDAAALNWLSSRIPGLDAASVRVLPLDAADAMFSAAAAKAESPLDFFTDPGFRGQGSYFLASSDLAALFARYEVHILTPPSGTMKDGGSFAMQGLVIGGGRIDALYDHDQFDFDNPMFPGYTYKVAGRVTERIQAPGDLTVDGVWVHAGFVTPRITRIVKTSPTEGRVETNYGSRVKPVAPIRRR